ncbi:MAG: prepilin-type N-terminal cleavage/methylation domain-containing protein [Nitrospirota bacterium]
MMKRNSGFSLIELLIVIAILGFVLAGVTQLFTGLFKTYRQQSAIAETNIEGNLGLELLRQDLSSAGYGIPWVIPPSVVSAGGYNEADPTQVYAGPYNDAPSGAPRAIVIGNGLGVDIPQSDVLVIKSVNIARNDACKKWTYIRSDPALFVKVWNMSKEDPSAGDHVIAIAPGIADGTRRTLATSSSNSSIWHVAFSDADNNFAPAVFSNDTHYIYALSPSSTPPRMPFNRADYYISTSNVPQRCAPGTGVLMKSVISHVNGTREDYLPLLDCVADFQVIFRVDADGDGNVDPGPSTGLATAQLTREQVREVRAYVLSHEGERDRDYTYADNTVYVGDPALGQGHNVDIVGDAKNYRWKVYTIAVKPLNMR